MDKKNIEETMKFSRIMGQPPIIVDCGRRLKPYILLCGIMRDDLTKVENNKLCVKGSEWRALREDEIKKELATHGWFRSLVFGYICPPCYEKLIEQSKEKNIEKVVIGFDLEKEK